MSLSAARGLFGVHSVAPYSRTDKTPYGIVKVLAGSSLSLQGELSKLQGGSNRYAWAVEDGLLTCELSMKVREYPNFLFELFLGKAPTSNAAETGGSITTLANYYGTTCKDATVGIASVSVIASTGAANLKFGKYMIKVVSTTTVDIYCISSDIDFLRGTDAEYSTDTLKVAAAQTVTSGMDTSITAFGFKMTGGSGSIGMTVGDTATFEVRPINTLSMDVTLGQTGATNPEFGVIVLGQKRGDGSMFEIDLLRCKGTGLPLQFEEFKWSEAEIKVEAFYDSVANAVAKIRQVQPTTP